MENNAFASPRYDQANRRLQDLLVAMRKGDIECFGKIAEDEALTLHALMMASNPSYLLMHVSNVIVINI